MHRLLWLVLGILISHGSAWGQDATTTDMNSDINLDTSVEVVAQTDPQAVTLAQQAILSDAGMTALSDFKDFTATGTITYFWADDPVQGSVTVRGRGADQFRLDAYLPVGSRTMVFSRGRGVLTETDGTVTKIPAHNSINEGIPTFPYPVIAAALNDPLSIISYLGNVEINGRQGYRVRIQRRFSTDPDDELSKLRAKDYFIDAQSFLVVKIQDNDHPRNTFFESFKREIELENYRPMNGILVPTVVREKIVGQTTWEFHLSKIEFNTGLSDTDFMVQ
jgi:hypothetical protein